MKTTEEESIRLAALFAVGAAAMMMIAGRLGARATSAERALTEERAATCQLLDALEEEGVCWTPAEDPSQTAGVRSDGVYAPEGECEPWIDGEEDAQ